MYKQNLLDIIKKISSGNNLGEKITLVGATKMVSADIINEAITLGLNVVAENKVQEFILKHDLIVGASQHFIGHLQTNKVKYIVGKVDLIHSVDSLHLATAISDFALKHNIVQDILIEINIGQEDSKSGFLINDAYNGVKEISLLKGVKIKGLMCMLPKTEDNNLKSELCLQMRNFFDKLNKEGFNLSYLSMGMSDDYKIAIKNGSNMIRIGSAIFGKKITERFNNEFF